LEQYDVAVVGGGLAGAATTFNLTARGLKVGLFERGGLAHGASGRNGGQVIQLDGRDRSPEAIMKRLRYSRRTVELLKEYASILEADFEFRQVGSLDIATTDAEVEELEQLCAMQVRAGDTEVEFLDHKALHEVSPFLSDEFPGARFRWSDGNLYPFALVRGLVYWSLGNGARLHTGADVERVVVEGGRVRGIQVDGEAVAAAERVVLATSAWTRELFPQLQVIPLRSHAALSDAIPEVQAPAFEVVVDGEILYGSTQFGNGHLLLGGGPDRPRSLEEQYDYTMSYLDTLKNASLLARVFPKLGDVHILRLWAGTMGTTPDGLPLVGASSLAEGLFVIAGFPNGMAFIPYIARLLSQVVAGEEPETDLGLFDPDRFIDLAVQLPERYNYTILADYLGRL
jgi:glycine/D-amino acid oxidase-like deaminating enzyme